MLKKTSAQPRARGVFVLLVASLLGCGGGDGGSGGAAGAGSPGMIGEPCPSTCASGLLCSRGRFAGLCTVQCVSDPGCEQWAFAARCFGTTAAECALSCANDTECPAGTTCKDVPEGNAPKACIP